MRYWYVLGTGFLLAGIAQIGLAVAKSTGRGYVMVGVAYLLIAAVWFTVGCYKHLRGPADAGD